MGTSRRMALRLLAGLLLTTTWACGDDGPSPSPAPLVLVLPAAVEGRLVSCPTCDPTLTVVLEFPVTVLDLQGPGGTIERLETIGMNRSRGLEIGRNVRPNTSYAFPDPSVPSHGQRVVEAGLVFGLPPPRDEIAVTVQVRLTDGRAASATSPVTVVAPG